MIRINLLPVRQSRRKLAGRQQLLLMGLAVILTLVCNFWWNRSRSEELASTQTRIQRTRAGLAELDRTIGEVKNLREQQAAVKNKLAVLEKLKAARQGPVRVLDELATLTPKRVWLRKLDEKGGQITFEGSAGSVEDVSAFLSALKRSPYFGSPELRKTTGKSDAKSGGKVTLVEFTVTAAVNYTPHLPVTVADVSAPGQPEKR
jgi:type IV pilus assembly protein PilN